MKNLLTSLFHIIITATCIHAQCPSGDVTLKTQAEVFAFKRLYPDCNEINGSLTINGFGETDIHNINPLSNLEIIRGGLFIGDCVLLESIEALNNLHTIEGGIMIQELPYLREISFLRNFSSIQNLNLYKLPSLFNLDDLQNLERIEEDLYMYYVNGNFETEGKIRFIGGTLFFLNAIDVENLDFFSQLDSLSSFLMYGCESLSDISGINNVQNQLSSISLQFNPLLNDCAIEKVCNALEMDSTHFFIRNNGPNCNDKNQLILNCGNSISECPVENININSQAALNQFPLDYPNCKELNVRLSLSSNPMDEITDLSPLNGITRFDSTLSIYNTLELIDLSGLETTLHINRLYLSKNDKLESLKGLENIQTINVLDLSDNNSIKNLNEIPLENSGLRELTLRNNITLNDITRVNKIDSLEYFFLDNNTSLNDFSQVDGIDYIGRFWIRGNNGFEQIEELENVLEIGELTFSQSNTLKKVKAPNSLKINEAISVTSNSLEEIYLSNFDSSIKWIEITQSDSLKLVDLGQGPDTISEELEIRFNRYLDTLKLPLSTRFINKSYIYSNSMLKGIVGGNSLKNIKDFYVASNYILEDISGFDHPIIIEKFELRNNPELSDCQIEPLCLIPDYKKTKISFNKGPCSSAVIALAHCPFTIKNPFDDVVITSKADLDVLKMEYPNADSILGNLYFDDVSDLSGEDLEYFRQIKYVDSLINFNNCTFKHFDDLGNIEFQSLRVTSCNSLTHLPVFSNITKADIIYVAGTENLFSIQGLENLVTIEDLTLMSCPKLNSLEGLEALREVSALRIRGTDISNVDPLFNLKHLGYTNITNCNQLLTLQGINRLESFGGGRISDNDRLTHLFNPIASDTIGDALYIRDCKALKELSGFDQFKYANGYIYVYNCSLLESISFPELNAVKSFMEISNNSQLKNIKFPKLTNCPRLEINRNSNLEQIGDFNKLDSIEYSIDILSNIKLNDISTFPEVVTTEYIEIKNNPELDICSESFICNHIYNGREIDFVRNGSNCITEAVVESGCGYQAKDCPTVGFTIDDDATAQIYNDHYSKCRVLNGDLLVIDDFSIQPDFKNLNAIIGKLDVESRTISTIEFPNLEFLLRFLSVNNTIGLESISFPKLNRFANSNGFHRPSILFEDNADLLEINTFNKISSSDGIINVVDNPRLKSISGFNGSFSPLGIRIQGNDQLNSITGFSSINEIGTIEIKDNQELTDVTGFEYIFNADQLTVTNNPKLSFCSVKGFCHHIDNDRAHTVNDNDQGCNSGQEILEKCSVAVVDQDLIDASFQLYPNPTSGILNIESQVEIISLEIISANGSISNVQVNYNQIDLNGLEDGMYWLRIKSPKNISTIKVMISKN